MQNTMNDSGILLMNPSLHNIFKTSFDDGYDSDGLTEETKKDQIKMSGSTGGGGEDFKNEDEFSTSKYSMSGLGSKKKGNIKKLMGKKRFNER